MDQQTSVGVEFKDADALLGLLHPDIEFRALTPGRSWEADDRQRVLSVLLGHWFEESDDIEAVEQLESDGFADRERVGYRFRVSKAMSNLRQQFGVLLHRDFRYLWLAQSASFVGDRVVTVALALFVIKLTGDATNLSTLAASSGGPRRPMF